MMGETGPCGPCSELHVDLTPAGDTKGRLVNQGTAECIEISGTSSLSSSTPSRMGQQKQRRWLCPMPKPESRGDRFLVPLPAKHVDTGMGFERITSIIQGTKNFTDFANAKISNYETDVCRPIFDELEKMSGKGYTSTLPQPNAQGAIVPANAQEAVDSAVRGIADHIRTLSFAVADGIQPGNAERNYVLRRILRRAVKYGRTLGFHEPFFDKLAEVLAQHMGDVCPELRTKLKLIKETLQREEESFNRTLDKGIALVEAEATRLILQTTETKISGAFAFRMYDEQGFPLDLTELMARERGLAVDVDGFKQLMEQQKTRARAAQKKTVIELSEIETKEPTHFLGYDHDHIGADVAEVLNVKGKTAVILNNSVL